MNPQDTELLPPAVVLGAGHNALGVFRSLGRRGIKIIAVSPHSGDPALASKFCVPAIPPADPTADEQGYVDFLLTLPALGAAPAVLIPTADTEVLLISRHRQRLQGRFRFLMTEHAIVEALINKRLFAALAEAHGLATPRTYAPRDRTALEAVSRELSYPCVVKPALSPSWGDGEFQRRFGAGAGGWIKRLMAGSREELMELYPRAAEFDPDLVIQEYIEGGEDALYDFYSYFDAGSEPVGAFMIRKKRTLPLDGNGIGTCVESVWEDEAAAAALDFLRAIRYRGNSAVCFKRCARSGKFYTIEVNARLALHHSLAAHCGVDLPYMAYLEASGKKPAPAAADRRKVMWLSFWDDLAAFRLQRKRGDVTLGQWMASLRGEKAHCFFAPDDLRPFALKSARALLGNVLGPARLRSLLLAGRSLALQACYYSGLLAALRRRRRSKNGGLLILMYHSVGKSDWLRPGLCVSEKNFARQIKYLTRHFRILPLESAVETMRRGEPLPDNAVALTFDDGFRDNYENAFPVLKKYRCAATLFVATEPVAHKRTLWPNKLFVWFTKTAAARIEFSAAGSRGVEPAVFDLRTEKQRRTALNAIEAALCRAAPPERERLLREVAEKLGFTQDSDPYDDLPMLTWEQLREMAAGGVTIGSHTVSHPALPALGREDALRELAESKALLEAKLGRAVKLFAYPFGGFEHFNAEIQNLVSEAGYEAACTTIRGINRSGTNPLALLRIGVQDDPPAVFAFKLSRFL